MQREVIALPVEHKALALLVEQEALAVLVDLAVLLQQPASPTVLLELQRRPGG